MRRLLGKYPDGYVGYEREKGLLDGMSQDDVGLRHEASVARPVERTT